MSCGLYDGLSPLPKDPVPGMAYVPYQQWNANLHDIDRALDAGTLFPVLDKPFYGANAMTRPGLPVGNSTCFWTPTPTTKKLPAGWRSTPPGQPS